MVKIRVILITCFFCAYHLSWSQKTGIKDNTTYYLSSIVIGKQKNKLAKDKGHIVFNAKKNTAACFTSCNFIQLKYELKDHTLKFTSIVPDKDPCPDPLVGLENDFKENLPKVSAYAIQGKKLILLDKKDTLMIFYEMNPNQK
jgi:heat shock protein HslJ